MFAEGAVFMLRQCRIYRQRARRSRSTTTAKKTLRISIGALSCPAENALVDYNKGRIARADHPLGKYKALHVNRDPAAIHEHEVRIPDQAEMLCPESLDEERFGCRPRLNTSL